MWFYRLYLHRGYKSMIFQRVYLYIWAIVRDELSTRSIRVHDSLTVHDNLRALKFDFFIFELQNVISDTLWIAKRHYLYALVNSMVKNEFFLLNSAICKPFYNQSVNSKAFKYTIITLKSKIYFSWKSWKHNFVCKLLLHFSHTLRQFFLHKTHFLTGPGAG